MLSTRGAGVVDADQISHELTRAGGAAIDVLRECFGERAISTDGALNRNYVRDLVFHDPDARKQLEELLHPLIRTEMRERTTALSASGVPYVVLMIPLLVESRNKPTDRVLVIDCSEAVQVDRVRARGISDTTARAIIAAQASREQRLDAADDVVLNDAALTDVESRVDRLHYLYLQLGRSRSTASAV